MQNIRSYMAGAIRFWKNSIIVMTVQFIYF